MKFTVGKVLLVGGVIASGIVFLFVMRSPAGKYWRFLARGEVYHAEVAAACDKLLSQDDETLPYQIRGSKLQLLPAVLRDLNPERVVVTTNYVMLRSDPGLMSYQIIWAPDDGDMSLWRLEVRFSDEPGSRVVFSRRRTAPGNLEGKADHMDRK